jgi:short-subunit dehydrogenase
MQRSLNDMVVVITGASAGIGEALARELARAGAKLVVSARRMDRLAELNRQLGGGHLCIRADVSQLDDCRELIERSFAHFGRIDTLVCNAGYGIYEKVEGTSPQQGRGIFAANFFGTTDCIHFALPRMLEQGIRDGARGQIMIVSSALARRGAPYLGMYSATKAAQLALAESLRVELAPRRIAVTTVHPIQTKTDFGRVAETIGKVKIASAPIRQRVEVVTRAMVRAIERPRAEVWTSLPVRWLLGVGTLMPSLVDRAMGRYRDQVARQNR